MFGKRVHIQSLFSIVSLSLLGWLILAGGTPLSDAPRVLTGGQAGQARLEAAYGKLPLRFEANQGQTDPRVNFLSRGPGYGLYLTPGEAVLSLRRPAPARSGKEREGTEPSSQPTAPPAVLRMKLLGANPSPEMAGLEELPGKSHYFRGNDPSKWLTNVPHYARVEYKDVYPGIDLAYYGNQQQLEYDFIIAPGADPKAIRLGFKGAKGMALDAAGNLVLDLEGGQVIQYAPVVYQETGGRHEPVESRYVLLDDNQVTFAVGEYDADRPLIIDPLLLAYSTFLGGGGSDRGFGIAVDASGNAYVTGETFASDFPTLNPLQTNPGGAGGDAFVTKLNPEGTALVYSTYLGGTGDDRGRDIAIDAAGNAYVTGVTRSTDFPTLNALDATCGTDGACNGGFFNAFVTKLNADGSAMVFSTYLGGSQGAQAEEIAVDSSNQIYIIGDTSSTDFPTVNAFQPALNGGLDVFITKLNDLGSTILYSTFLGGAGTDFAGGIAVDDAGNAYVTGQLQSPDFPTSAGAFQTVCGGAFCKDAFVAKLNTTVAGAGSLVYSTYLGGSSEDMRFGEGDIAVDTAGNAYVTGRTRSTNFPTVNAFQAICPGACATGFVTKLNASGTALVYSTYLGGSGGGTLQGGRGIAVDSAGSAYVTGLTDSSDFPVVDPFQATRDTSLDENNDDAFVTKFSPDGASLVYSTYLGGPLDDSARAIAVNAAGTDAYVTGSTDSLTFPITPGAFQTIGRQTVSGVSILDDGFVSKLSTENPAPVLDTLDPVSIPAGEPDFTLTVNGTGFVSTSVVRWNGADRATTFVSGTQLEALIPAADIAAAGTAGVTVFNPAPGGGESAPLTFTINTDKPVPIIDAIDPAGTLAGGPDFILFVSGENFVSGSVVRWNGADRATTFEGFGALQATITAADIAAGGAASVTVFNPGPGGGLSNAATFIITVNPAPTITLIDPPSAAVGGADFMLFVEGADFVPGAVVRWNGQDRVTSFGSSTSLAATITVADLAAPGTVGITVFNPAPGGGISNSLPFSIISAVPTITNLNPPNAVAGSADQAVSVFGANFEPGSVVRWNGADRATTFVSIVELQATFPAADLAAAGTAQITVFNPSPAPAGTLSNSVQFTVENPLPVLNSITPGTANAGSADLVVTLDGSAFVTGSIARWNGADVATTFVSNMQLQATIPAANLVASGLAEITVFSPAPGGGASRALPFTINSLDGALFDEDIDSAPVQFTTSGALTGNFQWTLTTNRGGEAGHSPVSSVYFGDPALFNYNSGLQESGFIDTSPIPLGAGTHTLTFNYFLQTEQFVGFDTAVVQISTDGGATFTTLLDNQDPALLAGAGGVGGLLDATGTWQTATADLTPFAGQSAIIRFSFDTVDTIGNNFEGWYVDDARIQGPVARPPNDDFVNAAPVLHNSYTNQEPTTGATIEFTDPLPGCAAKRSRSVWFQFTPATTGNVAADTFGSDYDTILSAWTGAAGALTEAACNDDAGVIQSQINFLATAGTTYYFMVSDFNSAGGNLIFNFTFDNPLPSISALTPNTAIAGSAAFTLTVDGSGFVPESVVNWSVSGPRVTTFVSDTQLQASILAGDIQSVQPVNVTVVNPAPAGGTSNMMPFSVTSPAPNPLTLIPDNTLVGGFGFSLSVQGSSFFPDSVIRWNGTDRDTIFVSDGELQTQISAADIAAAGTANLTIFNPGGGGESAPLIFTINNPAPVIDSLSPSDVIFGSPDFTLTLTGAGFVSGSVVRWNGADRATTFVSGTELQATILAADVATAGTANLTVFNTAPGGGESPALTFTILADNPVPAATALVPNSATAGDPDLTLTVTGTGFVSVSVVRWNGVDRVTTFVSSTELQATIPASDLAASGTATVTVFNPTPGGGESGGLTFTINNPLPVLNTISPASADAGSADFTLTVTGTGFVSGSVIRWNGADRTTTFGSSTQLTTTIPSADLNTGSIATVTVFNPAPGGGESAGSTFTIDTYAAGVAAGSPASQTVSKGQTAQYTLAVTPAGSFDQPVRFTCSGLPSKATCSFNPSQITPGTQVTNVTLSISTTADAMILPVPRTDGPKNLPLPFFGLWWVALGLSLLGIAIVLGRLARPGRLPFARWAAIPALVLFLLLAGCGGGGSPPPPPPQPIPGTPSGSFNVTVTAISGSFSTTTTVTLVVQ